MSKPLKWGGTSCRDITGIADEGEEADLEEEDAADELLGSEAEEGGGNEEGAFLVCTPSFK